MSTFAYHRSRQHPGGNTTELNTMNWWYAALKRGTKPKLQLSIFVCNGQFDDERTRQATEAPSGVEECGGEGVLRRWRETRAAGEKPAWQQHPWTTRHRLRGGVLKRARCICPNGAAELLALRLGLATLAASTRTTPQHCQDSPWHRAQLGVHLDNEQMSFNRTGRLQRPRLTWMASVVCRPLSCQPVVAHITAVKNFTLQNWPETHPLAPQSSTSILRGQLSLVNT